MSSTQLAGTQSRSNLDGLRRMVDGNDTIAGRVFNSTIQILIILSLLAFCVEKPPVAMVAIA